MIINRVWAMPNRNTFKIKPIAELINRYLKADTISIDPFARDTKIATYRNDLNPATGAEYHMHALDFLSELIQKDIKGDLILFDPPYSPHQTKECYEGFGINMKYEDDGRHGWSKTRTAMANILKSDGYCISCGWDTIGLGKKHGFEIIEILLCCHGIGHNDTIVMVERRTNQTMDAWTT